MGPAGLSAADGLTKRIAAYASALAYEDLPASVVSTLKRIILDCLGTTLAANTLGAGVPELVRFSQDMSGTPESTLVGLGIKVSATMAAFVNGGMAHALNYDDMAETGVHLGATSVPATLAAAERKGGVSGREFLAALAAGTELMARLGAATEESPGTQRKVLRTQLLGYFSAAVSAGRLLRLTALQMHSALGLALMQASGTMQVVLDGDPAKAIYAAFPNYGGLLSALLSRQGLRADCAALEGSAGLFQLYYQGNYSREVLENGLGKEFHVANVRFKPWPTSGVIHPFIEAALKCVTEENIQVPDVDHVRVHGSPRIQRFCEPQKDRKHPLNPAAAADSIFFAVAKTIANRKVVLSDFMPQGLKQREVADLTERMDHSVDGTLGHSAVVEITLRSGRRYTSRIATPLGHATRPLTYEQIVNKFLDCASYAAKPIAKENLNKVTELVNGLEEVPDVALLPALLSGGA